MQKKDEYRALVKKLRKQMTAEESARKEDALCGLLLRHPAVRDAACVYCYISIEGEAGTRCLIEALWARKRLVAVPRVEGKTMAFYYIHSWEETRPGCMGIPEPEPSCARAAEKGAPMIVPGLAFDCEGHRIGYGGGYYDRFLTDEPEHPAIGAAYAFQVFQKVPSEAHDRKLDEIIAV